MASVIQARKTRDWTLRREFGITLGDYERMKEDQAGRCAICRKVEDLPGGLRVDHNHQSGEVRGLLCHSCNVALGHFKDNIELLEAALDYLERPL